MNHLVPKAAMLEIVPIPSASDTLCCKISVSGGVFSVPGISCIPTVLLWIPEINDKTDEPVKARQTLVLAK